MFPSQVTFYSIRVVSQVSRLNLIFLPRNSFPGASDRASGADAIRATSDEYRRAK